MAMDGSLPAETAGVGRGFASRDGREFADGDGGEFAGGNGRIRSRQLKVQDTEFSCSKGSLPKLYKTSWSDWALEVELEVHGFSLSMHGLASPLSAP